MRVRCWLAILSLFLGACSQAFWNGVSEGLAASRAGAGAPAPPTELLLFGGDGHKTFLGCVSCSKYDAASIFNQYGEFGSTYSATSIANRYGEFGSPYSAKSACNQYATDPPVIVDRIGTFYGRLTINPYVNGAIRPGDLLAWLRALCAG